MDVIASLAKNFKAKVVPIPMAYTAFFVGLLGLLVAVVMLPGKWAWAGGVFAILIGFVAGSRAQRAYERRVHKRYFRNVFLPAIDERGVDIKELLAVMKTATCANSRTGSLVQKRPLLEEVLREQGRLPAIEMAI